MQTDQTTFITPIGLLFTLGMGVLMIILPRRFALAPVIVLICYMTMGQRVVVVGMDFTMLRILMLFGWIRLAVRAELHRLKLNTIDKLMLWWVLSAIVTGTFLGQSTDILINRLGIAYNAVGMYFLFRFLIRDVGDACRVFKMTAVLIVPLAILMLVEKDTLRNPFALFGGVREHPVIRLGVVRCQGPFAHSILAGTFGATLIPFFIALWLQHRGKFLAVIGIISSTVIVIAAGSSGPVFTYLAGILGFVLWRFRQHMRLICWALLSMVVALHIVMKAPVWYLIARVAVFSGSAAWHRAYLIDRAIANIGDWWLVGTTSPESWGFRLFDVTNQFIVEGTRGGLLTMILFIAIIAFCFKGVSRARLVLERQNKHQRLKFCVWGLGASLLAHVVSFFGVSYFDQNFIVYMLLLAMISTASGVFPAAAAARREHSAVVARGADGSLYASQAKVKLVNAEAEGR